MRFDNRKDDEYRQLKIQRNFTSNPHGSVLISMGNTVVLCTASVDEKVPPFLNGKGSGWVTAEYSLLPGSTVPRSRRDKNLSSGRTHEIQRLIGRSLRSVVDLEKLGERTVWIDCDVIQADGGTRTASITGGYIAMRDALTKLMNDGLIKDMPLKDYMAAISVGIVDGKPLLDLNYREDSSADVDMNIVMTDNGGIVEIQGTGEKYPFTEEMFTKMFTYARNGISSLIEEQKRLYE